MATIINNVTFESLKEDIIRVFEHLHKKLDERKHILMSQLLAFKEEKECSTDLDKGINLLKETKELVLAKLEDNVLERERVAIEKTLDDQIKEVETRKLNEKSCLVKLRCYTVKLEEDISQISLVEDIRAYANKLTPVIKCGAKGPGHKEFNAPCGICIDDTKNIVYVADRGNKRIQVLNKGGEYVSEFGTNNLTKPYGVAITEKFVFVTDQFKHSIVQFDRDGAFIRITGSYGSAAPLVFNGPRGIAANNNKLYVCDSANHRIQVLDTSLKYIEEFTSNELFGPSGINIDATIIHVLPETNNSVHLFSLTGYYPLKVIKLTGQEYNMTAHFFFTVDQFGNYLISARNENHIRIFDNTGALRHSIGEGHMKYPSGISVDSSNNIICVSCACIFQIY